MPDTMQISLACGSANTWREDVHLPSSVPCPAHTVKLSGPKRGGEDVPVSEYMPSLGARWNVLLGGVHRACGYDGFDAAMGGHAPIRCRNATILPR